MKDKIEQRITDITSSMQGSQRARPDADLYDRIEAKIFRTTGREISIQQVRYAAAAAILLLFLNIVGVKKYVSTQQAPVIETYADYNSSQLMLDYNYYDQ